MNNLFLLWFGVLFRLFSSRGKPNTTSSQKRRKASLMPRTMRRWPFVHPQHRLAEFRNRD